MAAQTPQPQQYSPLLKQKKGCSDRQGEAPKRFVDILAEELKEIEQLRQNREWKDPAKEAPQPPAGGPDPTTNPAAAYPAPAAAGQPHEDPKDPDAIISRAHGLGLVGLAFSGGGIRSATFNLGVLQALADFDLLKRFDYLSTVSGGGYIGSWLTAWIRRRTLDEVVRGLQTNRTPNRNHWEVEQIRFLREYSNYLTPRLGFLSLDTWAMIATYVRNTLLNLTILVLALASILLLPHAAVAVGALARAADPMHSWTLVCAGVLLYMIVQFMAVNTASKVFTPGNDERFACFTDPVYARVAGAAMLPAAWCLSTWLSGFPESPAGSSGLKWAERVGPVHVTFGAIVGSGWLEWAERGALTYFLLWLVTRIVGLVAELVSAAAADPVKRVIEPSLRLLLCITHKAESPPKSVVKFHEWWERHPRVPIYLCHALTVVMGSVLLAIVWTITFPYHDWVSAHIPNRWVIITPGVLTAIFFIIVWMSRRRDVSKRRWEFLEFFGMLFATPFAGAVGGVLLGGLIAVFNGLAGRNWGPLHVFVLGTPLVVAVLLVVATLHVGLMGLMLSNQKREWWSRLGGWVAVLAIGWVVVCGLSLYGWPVPDAYKSTTWEHLVKWGLTPAWILSTVGGVLGGKSKATGDDKNPWVERAVGIAPYIFVVGLLEVVSYSLSGVLAKLDGVSWAPCGLKALIATGASCAPCYGCVPPAPWRYTVVWLGIVAAALLLVALFLAWRVDVNDFSMHLFYRNRLVRCYLGASLGTRRKPHPFTGFDPNDDIFLKYLRAEPCPGDPNDDIFLKDLLAKPYSGPFPILNASLNLVKGNELAWQERKAESFVFTPLNCGFDAWIEKLRAPMDYAYRPTECYGYTNGGFYLGTAMSISGAAASPNMGYHSKPALGFLMTVFNVRLGWWAANPRGGTWQRPSPLLGLGCLLSELAGNTDDESRYVYVSDGGHFENLGIYELVKRRCKFIVACDAGADGSYAFGDLGNAIRKCREDMGVEIKIKTDRIFPRGTDKRSEWHCAAGEIHYENVDPGESAEHPGILLYLKASLTGDEPADVLNYGTACDTFPHETTADQWFTESQFESYRRLGQHIACTLFDKAWNKTGVRATSGRSQEELAKFCNEQLFKNLSDAWPSCLGNC